MDTNLLLRGLIIGFSIAAPVGPIGVLCIGRTLAAGRAYRFVSGLGAATDDALYGAIAAFGLTFPSRLLITQQSWLRPVGGAYGSTLFLTLTNPMTLLSFAAIFAGLGIGSTTGSYRAAAALVLAEEGAL